MLNEKVDLCLSEKWIVRFRRLSVLPQAVIPPAVLCALCNIGDADRWASGFHLCLQKNECRCFCRKCSALQIPGFGNGAVHSGIVRNGADLVCLDNPQAEKTIPD